MCDSTKERIEALKQIWFERGIEAGRDQLLSELKKEAEEKKKPKLSLASFDSVVVGLNCHAVKCSF